MTRLKAFLKILSWWLKIFCAVFVIALPLLAIYDHFFPWQPAVMARATHGNGLWIGVGMSYKSSARKGGEVVQKYRTQRSYLVLSALLTSPRIVTVSQDQDGKISVEESILAFWFLLFTYLACTWVAWRYLYQPRLKKPH